MKQNFYDGRADAPKFNYQCKKCAAIILPDELCEHENCQDCQEICCAEKEKSK